MVIGPQVLLLLVLLALLALGAWAAWRATRGELGRQQGSALPALRRAELAAAIAEARWVPGHDEIDGTTRVLVRRTYTGLDGHPVVLEERVLETFPAADPAWEGLFTEAMSRARLRCAYLNAEEAP
jgi:hypothetical protein